MSRQGKPGSGGGGGTITLRLLNSTDGLPHVLQKVTFDVFTTATRYPWVTVDWYANGVWVYHASKGIFATSLGQDFTLRSNTWISGEHHTITNQVSTSFHVYA